MVSRMTEPSRGQTHDLSGLGWFVSELDLCTSGLPWSIVPSLQVAGAEA